MPKLTNIKYSLIFIFLFAFMTTSSNAQDKHVRVDLDPNVEIEETLAFNSGLIIKTEWPKVVGKQPKKLFWYDTQGELKNISEIKPRYQYTPLNKMLVTPNEQYLYNIEVVRPDLLAKYGPDVTQIDSKGNLRSLKSGKNVHFGKSLMSFFCDDQYLYFLTSQNADEKHKKKKEEEKLLLTRFSHYDFSSKTITLKTPSVLPDENTSFWFYLGSIGEEHFLASKTCYPDFGRNDFQVIAFNAEGEVKRTIKFDVTLKDKFTRVSYVYWPVAGSFENIVDYDRILLSITTTTPGAGPGGAGSMTSTTTRYKPTEVAFGNLLLDAQTQSFYAFGLLGPKPFKAVASQYEGFYVTRFDLNGNLVWQLQEPERKELMDDNFFKVHASPFDRDIALRPGADKNELVIGLKSAYVTYTIDSKGVLNGKPSIHEDFPGISPYRIVRAGKSYDFMTKQAKSKVEKQVYFKQFLFSDSEIVVLPTKKKPGYDLYYFEK